MSTLLQPADAVAEAQAALVSAKKLTGGEKKSAVKAAKGRLKDAEASVASAGPTATSNPAPLRYDLSISLCLTPKLACCAILGTRARTVVKMEHDGVEHVLCTLTPGVVDQQKLNIRCNPLRVRLHAPPSR